MKEQLPTHSALSPREQRNRANILESVRHFWIKGVLEQSLYRQICIDLNREYHPDAVQYPWDVVLQRPDMPDQMLPEGTSIADVYDEAGRSLLILGAPGAGKTTMLLDLTRTLIARAEQDNTLPMPIVFNLATWSEKREPLTKWLVEELNMRYDVPRKVGKKWVANDQIVPLLDGLDEVQQEHRAACVAAINTYRESIACMGW